MLVELRHAGSEMLLHRVELDSLPIQAAGLRRKASRFVMQRRHRYALRNGRYDIASITLVVKPQNKPADAVFWRHGWVIGDPECRFNARSPLLRCAVWPQGPCHSCLHRENR